MARKTYTAEQIIGMLREADVRPSQGEKVFETASDASRRSLMKVALYA